MSILPNLETIQQFQRHSLNKTNVSLDEHEPIRLPTIFTCTRSSCPLRIYEYLSLHGQHTQHKSQAIPHMWSASILYSDTHLYGIFSVATELFGSRAGVSSCSIAHNHGHVLAMLDEQYSASQALQKPLPGTPIPPLSGSLPTSLYINIDLTPTLTRTERRTQCAQPQSHFSAAMRISTRHALPAPS